MLRPTALWLATLLIAACLAGCQARGAGPELAPPRTSLDAYERGRDLLTRALDRLGGPGALRQSGGLVVEGEGDVSLGARRQGRHPDSTGRTPYRDRLVVDATAERVLFEVDAYANADAREHVQYAFDAAGRLRIADRLSGGVFWDRATDDHRRRYARIVPHLLLADALAHRSSIRHVGQRVVPADADARRTADAVAVTLPPSETVTLLVDASSGRLMGAEYVLDVPLRGDARVQWTYGPERAVDGLGRYPTGHRITLGGDVLANVRYTRVEAGAGDDDFAPPPGAEVPEPPDVAEGAAPESFPAEVPPPGPLREIVDGVYLAPNVRPGFHVLVVEFADFAMVVDAPAGWRAMHTLPAHNWVPWASSSAVGQRLLDTVREHLPGKPVRYVALTHFHSDHAGGIRPFVDAGATVLASAVTRPVVERAVAAPVTLAPDALTGRTASPSIEVVDGTYAVRDSAMEVRLIDVGPNPHADGMLVAYLPRQKILYQSDLFEPLPDRFFPSTARLPVMRWFVDWLDGSGLEVDRVYAMHGVARVRPEHLETIRRMD